ncbi:Cysteine-rich protein [Phytophthora palmivora]|uniref:Cysteine-rich protein n=1 Tax=Phytophthora palmivora TaxID=4796 RepID=A0A2P4YKK0_9STRA|nr:Cysteine-rich protein [Phytophthora palmivora]
MRIVGSLVVLLVALVATNIYATQETSACDPPCEQDEVCQLQQVQCITQPCDPVPTCVPIEASCTKKCSKYETCQIDADGSQYCYNPCAAVLCLEGTTCHVEQVQCIQAPCPPIVTCKPIKKPCTKRVLRESN